MNPPVCVGAKVRIKMPRRHAADRFSDAIGLMTVIDVDGNDVLCVTETGTECTFPDNILELVE